MGKNTLLEIVGAAISRDPKVEIAVGGSDAYCTEENGRTRIVLPNLGDDKLPETLGFLWHEAGHARFTPKGLSLADSMLHGVWNALEDPRMESRIIDSYPGAASRLSAVVAHVFHDGAQCAEPTGPLDVVMWVNLKLRAERLLQPVSKRLLAQVEANARAAVGDAIADRAWEIALQAFADRDGSTVPACAGEILALLNLPGSSQEDQQGDGGSSDGQKKQPGQSGDQKTSPSPEQGDGEGNASSSSQDGEEKDAPSQRNRRGGVSKKRSKTPSRQPLDESVFKNVSLGDILRDTLKEASKGHRTDALSGPLARLTIEDDPRAASSKVTGEDIVQMAAGLSGLRQALVRLIQARKEKPVAPKMTGNRLLSRRLYQAATPEPRIFGGRQNVKAVNTALQVLVDLSGSMNDGSTASWKKAQVVAYAMARALQGQTGVVVKVDAFRYVNLVPMVGWGKRPDPNRFRVPPVGSTPTGNAIYTVLPDLLGRAEAKKVLIVITDGDPDNQVSAIRAITTAREGGVIVIGIGIGSGSHNAVKRLFGQHAVLADSVEDLPKVLSGVLSQALEK